MRRIDWREKGMMRRLMYACGGLLAAVGVVIAPGAAQADVAPAQFPCGFYEANGQAYWGHCDEPPPTWVIIRVDYYWATGLPDRDWCVPPGVTRLGYDFEVVSAWWTGRLC